MNAKCGGNFPPWTWLKLSGLVFWRSFWQVYGRQWKIRQVFGFFSIVRNLNKGRKVESRVNSVTQREQTSSQRCAIIKFLPTKCVQWVSGVLWEPFCHFSQIDKQKVHPWMWQLTMDRGFILCANSCKRQFRCDRRVHNTEYMMLHQEGDCVCMCVCVFGMCNSVRLLVPTLLIRMHED